MKRNAQFEPIAQTEESSLYSRHISEIQFNHPLHYHPEIEITSIVRSSGTSIVGDYVGTFGPGDLFLLGRNLQHLFTNTLRPEGGAEAEVLQFNRDFSNGFIDSTPELTAFARLLDEARLGIVFDRKTGIRATSILRNIRRARALERMRTVLELIDCLLSADETRLLASPGYVGRSTPQDSERMQIACRYIMEHFTEEISHQELATRVHLTQASFCRLFKKMTRKTCTAFINEIRLGHACRLLMEGDVTITEVASASGYRNLSNFNRCFRERYDLSPRQYQKLMQEGRVDWKLAQGPGMN